MILFPVIASVVTIGARIVLFTPSTRSCHTVPVAHASSFPSPNGRTRLSNRTSGSASIAIDVRTFPDSASLLGCVARGAAEPVTMIEAISTSRDLPAPRTFADAAKMGDGPAMAALHNIVNGRQSHAAKSLGVSH